MARYVLVKKQKMYNFKNVTQKLERVYAIIKL